MSGRWLVGGLQVGLGLGPRSWQQSDAAPKSAPEKQPPQPVNAVGDKLLGNTVIVEAITDRLLHHGHVLSIRGERCRQTGCPATTAKFLRFTLSATGGARLILLCQALVAPGKYMTFIKVPKGTAM